MRRGRASLPTRGQVAGLLAKVRGIRGAGERAVLLSELLLGLSYAPAPLVGSAESREVFTATLDGFDCVTYVETVLALALSPRAADFGPWLRTIRYDGGVVDWRRRNHYMTVWVRANRRAGVVRAVAPRLATLREERLLDAVPGLGARRLRLSCAPVERLGELEPRLRGGDLVLFASTRRDLDVFHCGLLVRGEGGWRLRHAARSAGAVIEQDLGGFLAGNTTAGLIVARPAGEKREPQA